MKIRKIFRADKNDGLEVSRATMIIQTPLPGSVYFHTETAHTSQSSEKTIRDNQCNRLLQQQQAGRQAGDAEMSSLFPHSRTRQWDLCKAQKLGVRVANPHMCPPPISALTEALVRGCPIH